MKKTVSVLLALLLVFSLSVTAFAAEGISLVSAADAQGNDAADSVSLTDFDSRAELPEEALASYEGAVTTVMSAFEKALKTDARLKVDDDSIVYLYDTFFATLEEAEGLELPYTLDITKPEGFLALMSCADGAWSVIDSEIVDGNVCFEAEKSQPVAVVCVSKPAPTPTKAPSGGDTPVVPSAENNAAPQIVSATDAKGEDSGDAIVIVPYRDRETLPKVHKDVFTLAYEDLYENFDKLPENDEQLKAAAGENVPAVSDAFFVSANDVSKLNYPLSVEIELAKYGAENPDEFIALIQCVDGVWSYLESSVSDGVVSASIDQIGPFAVVVAAAE